MKSIALLLLCLTPIFAASSKSSDSPTKALVAETGAVYTEVREKLRANLPTDKNADAFPAAYQIRQFIAPVIQKMADVQHTWELPTDVVNMLECSASTGPFTYATVAKCGDALLANTPPNNTTDECVLVAATPFLFLAEQLNEVLDALADVMRHIPHGSDLRMSVWAKRSAIINWRCALFDLAIKEECCLTQKPQSAIISDGLLAAHQRKERAVEARKARLPSQSTLTPKLLYPEKIKSNTCTICGIVPNSPAQNDPGTLKVRPLSFRNRSKSEQSPQKKRNFAD